MKQSRASKPKISKKIDRYEVRDEIGQGGMATVYYAFDPRVGREVAIKILLKEFTHDPTFRQRFEREVKAIAQLEHPAIVPVYDYGEQEEQPYLVMRYMSGGTLEDKLKIGALSMPEAGAILARIGSALEQAHSRGIIHRDLKPGNVLFDQYGNAFLSDFGIVKLAAGNKTLTEAGGMVGTPAYMSPEQVQGASNLDGRSDIYSLGVILFEMLSGVIPYNADTPMGVAVMQVTEPVPRIRAKIPNLPKTMETVISRAMAKRREDRYENVNQMVDAVLAVTGTDMKQMMESGTFTPAAGAALGANKAAKLTNANIAPPPNATLELPPQAKAGAKSAKKSAKKSAHPTNPLPAPLNVVPLWALAAGGVVLLVVILGLALGGLGGGSANAVTPPASSVIHTQGAVAVSNTTEPGTPTVPAAIVPSQAAGMPQILFASNRLGSPAFFLMDIDGGNLSKLLVDTNDNRTPDWSPDGTKIAYRCQDASRKYICLINADGSGRQMLTSADTDSYDPSWSPDGTKIAYVSGVENDAEIYVMDADGKNPVRLTKNGSGDFDPTWSPDGSKILFDSNRPAGALTLWTMNADGSNQIALIKDGIPNYKPDWSPDGKLILFVSERDGTPEIYEMHADGLNEVRLTHNEAADVSPSWSPDGSKIAFSSRRDSGNAEIYIMNPDGSNQTRVTNDPSDDLDPVWKP